MKKTPKKKTPNLIHWVVSPELRDGKLIDSVWVSALTEEGAEINAFEALKIFGIKRDHVVDLSICKLDDVVMCY